MAWLLAMTRTAERREAQTVICVLAQSEWRREALQHDFKARERDGWKPRWKREAEET